MTPNRWGFYDIHGNVFEWCLDTYRAYPGGTAYSDSGTMKIFRGGAYYCPSSILRSACRAEPQKPDYRWVLGGFRVVIAPPHGEAED
ncbi:MAG: SUMF1/EgtB/PvdO family nonheme iron enzyme [Verrucomicrobia bacterium]|nr:SUMF1/EgtB/PvdO family nonheme iron enzyme [Verrucomicrobiota bacterium]MBT7735623.1 SUMF1/EgtB/PvdO family nonheme iron enzyme [Verrucomicrobiota bacterium]